MPLVADEGEGGELGIADLDPFGIVTSLPFGEDPQAALGGRGRDEVDDYLVGGEGSTPPVLGDEAEHAMLDLYLHRPLSTSCVTRTVVVVDMSPTYGHGSLRSRERRRVGEDRHG